MSAGAAAATDGEAVAGKLRAPCYKRQVPDSRPLTIVSNRGPVEFSRGENGERTLSRGGGGLVTALSGLVTHREALWIASAMTDEDNAIAEEAGGEPVEFELDGVDYEVCLVKSDPVAYDRFYNVIANPILWFIQHYLWDLSNAPDIRQTEKDAWELGYKVVNEDIARQVIRSIEGQTEPVVMLHDYHLYTAPGLIREARPDAFLQYFVHIPWSQPDSWRVLPNSWREEIYRSMLANDIIGFHTRSYCHAFLQACRELMELEVDWDRRAVIHNGRETLVRDYPLSIDTGRLFRATESPEVAAYEEELLKRRREHLIIRVDRADLSKNVLRGFSAFDTFLEQHPEFREKVTFIAHLQPSRLDVPEYAEYMERIEALVAVVNHRHGTTDWMPIDLRIYENFPEAVARYRHFDLLMVNSLFDGMNLVAKEAPAVNTRDGVVILSENTGAHEELGDCTLSVNPFDIQEQADAIHRALTMDPEEKRLRAERLKQVISERDPGDWIDEQIADIDAARGARSAPA
jgi:trehalose 6-phosphate synthase